MRDFLSREIVLADMRRKENAPVPHRAKIEGAKEFAEEIRELLLVTYGDYGSPLGDITGEEIMRDIDELLEEYTK